MTATAADPRSHPDILEIARCFACGSGLAGSRVCGRCGKGVETPSGILHAIGPLEGRNKVAAAYYDGPAFDRFRPFEKGFLALQGPGQARARRQLLAHLPNKPNLRILEVGIGDGDNRPLLAASTELFGVDIARNRLTNALAQHPDLGGRLAWAEAEALPFEDGSFDAVFTVGGINYFRDPETALREMARVARPGAPLVAADELPDLHHFGVGHMLGLESIDAFWLRLIGLDRAFVAMVMNTPPLVEPAARRAWPGCRRLPIWNRLGYCLVHERGA
jgi:SAM-dependent methyltransferase